VTTPLRIAVIGDVHGKWAEADRAWFDASEYDLVMCVGDLATYRRDGREIARSIARLRKPTLLMPGNHDGVSLPHLAAEALGARALLPLLSLEQPARRRRFAEAAHPLELCGYCSHPIEASWGTLTVIGARPHSMGGAGIAFRSLLQRLYGVGDIGTSVARLKALVDRAEGEILFFAHNGPTGLGSARDDVWGCDFKRSDEDFGDVDLRGAIDYARSRGQRVRAVIAGHMHHTLKGGGTRKWWAHVDGVTYLNAARVPRIERSSERRRKHHHVRLVVTEHEVSVEPVIVELTRAQ
jgi:uncharacterized protein (TIGR04168 family)